MTLYNIGADIEDRITNRLSRQHYQAVVVDVVDGQLYVRRLGASGSETPEGPYWAARGAGNLIRIGETVLVNWASGQPYVDFPPEADGGISSALSIAGSDLATRQTTSHTAWENLLDITDLQIDRTVPFRIEWHTQVETVGAPGAAAKQLQLVFNNSPTITITLTSGSATFWSPWLISSASPIDHDRRGLLLTSGSPNPLDIPIGPLTRLSVNARTNDTGEGNDIVRCSELVVSI